MCVRPMMWALSTLSLKDQGYPLGIKVVQLQKLPPESIYPPPKHKILERHYSADKLAALRLRKTKANDESCTDTNLYHVLNPLYFKQDRSVILMDGDRIIAIVIHSFVMDNNYFKDMKKWCANLILEPRERRHGCLD